MLEYVNLLCKLHLWFDIYVREREIFFSRLKLVMNYSFHNKLATLDSKLINQTTRLLNAYRSLKSEL